MQKDLFLDQDYPTTGFPSFFTLEISVFLEFVQMVFHTIGYIKSDGTVQDGSYRTIGHADGIPLSWTAFYFFFMK